MYNRDDILEIYGHILSILSLHCIMASGSISRGDRGSESPISQWDTDQFFAVSPVSLRVVRPPPDNANHLPPTWEIGKIEAISHLPSGCPPWIRLPFLFSCWVSLRKQRTVVVRSKVDLRANRTVCCQWLLWIGRDWENTPRPSSNRSLNKYVVNT